MNFTIVDLDVGKLQPSLLCHARNVTKSGQAWLGRCSRKCGMQTFPRIFETCICTTLVKRVAVKVRQISDTGRGKVVLCC